MTRYHYAILTVSVVASLSVGYAIGISQMRWQALRYGHALIDRGTGEWKWRHELITRDSDEGWKSQAP